MHTSRTGWIWDGEQWNPPGEASPPFPGPAATPSPFGDSFTPLPSGQPSTPVNSGEPFTPVSQPIGPASGDPGAPPPSDEMPITGRVVSYKGVTAGPQASVPGVPRSLRIVAAAVVVGLVVFGVSRLSGGGGDAHGSGTPEARRSGQAPVTSGSILPATVYQPVSHDYTNAYKLTLDGKTVAANSDVNVTNDAGNISIDTTLTVGTQTIETTQSFHVDAAGWHWDEEDVTSAGEQASCIPSEGSDLFMPAKLTAGAKTSVTMSCTAGAGASATVTKVWTVAGSTHVTVAGRSIAVVKIAEQTSGGAQAGGTTVSGAGHTVEYFDPASGMVVQAVGEASFGGKTASLTEILDQRPQPGTNNPPPAASG